MNSWPTSPGKTEQHIKWDVTKAKEIYFTAWESPLKQVFLSKPANHPVKRSKQQQKKSCHFYFFLFVDVFIMRIFHFLFCFLSDKSYLQYCHYFFSGDCLSWILESHRLEMSKCKTVIDLWDVMRIHPGVGFVFVLFFSFSFSVNVQFSPYCAIILPKNDFKTYFITTCKYQRCPIPWQKIYKCCFILFSIFWKTAMMFMWCIVFQLVAIIKNTSCRRLLWLLLLTDLDQTWQP